MSRLINEMELRQYLKCSRTYIYLARQRGMPCVCLGRVYRYDLAEVIVWLKSGGGTDTEEQSQSGQAETA